MKLWWKNKNETVLGKTRKSATLLLAMLAFLLIICTVLGSYRIGIVKAVEDNTANEELSEEECEGVSTSQEQITNALVFYRSIQALQACSTLYGFYNQNGATANWTPENIGESGGPYYIETGTDGGQQACTTDNMEALSKRAGLSTSFLEAARTVAGCDAGSTCNNNITIAQIRDAISNAITSGSDLDIGGGSDIYRFRMIYDTFVIQCTDGGFSKANEDSSSSGDLWHLDSGPYLSEGEYLLAEVTAKKSCGGLFNSCDSTMTIGPTMPETIPGLTLTDAQRQVLQNNNKQFTMSCNEMNDALEGSGGEYITSRKCAGDELEDLTDMETSPSEVATGEEDETCHSTLGIFGWLFCNGSELLQSIITGFLTWIDGQLNWTFLAQNSQTILPRWQDFLNIANVLFVIAFLVMIYSMATSTGLSNYDVKKMLPRLIVVAIIVNISFYICAALVDLSNIVGSGLYSLIAGDAADKGFKVELDLLESGVVLIVTVIAAFLFIGTGLLAIVVIFLCLYLRQVALIVLTIVSPIALVCYLLPNTEQWAKKWFSWFSRMLLIYPMFAAVWGGSIWLGNTITATNINDNGAIPIPDFVPQMICLIIPALSILPLFKASGGLMGTISNKVAGGAARTGLAGRINKTTGRPAKAIGRGVGRIATNNFVTRGITGAVGSGTGHLASKVSHIPGIGGALSRGLYSTSNKANAHAGYVSAQAKAIDDQAMTQAKSDLSQVSQAELIQIATTGQYKDKAADEHILRAATEMSQDNMDEDDVKKMLVKRAQIAKELADKGRKDEAQRLLDNAANGAKKSGHYAGAGGALDRDFRNGKWGDNAEQAYNDAVAKKMSNMSAEQMAGTSANTLKHMNEAVAGARVDSQSAAIANARDLNRTIKNNSKLKSRMNSKAAAELDLISTQQI